MGQKLKGSRAKKQLGWVITTPFFERSDDQRGRQKHRHFIGSWAANVDVCRAEWDRQME
jgi:hypothetical protein